MRLVVFFPGIGYHCDKPLLYYADKLVREANYDIVIKLNYSYDGKNIRDNKEKMHKAFENLYSQTEEKLINIDFDQYDDILFISKSIGTIIASAFATKHNLKCKQVLYTPLEHTFSYLQLNSIAFIGTNDSWSDVNTVIGMAKSQGVDISVYDGANHSLE